MFDSLLIANRGEIACRVIRTAKAMGLRTVAVYSEADAGALHVEMADEAFLIGPPPAAESYLRADRILEVAERAGAAAVHPGYGFLSENADFAEACSKAGIAFVGPTAEAIRAMGSKSEAKRLMEGAGVPLVPGYHGEEQGADFLAGQAERIGYPVLIKASAGGGGKGMRLVEDPAGFMAALEGAKREAKASFADDQVLIERYLRRPRHIEVQIIGDAQGAILTCGDRDCSIQRRHQKIIEEAPAPGLAADVREALHRAAVAAGQAIGYRNAGTVEFIMSAEGEFFFMEMNTRLQVEHPVTEMVISEDLVFWQLSVAAGERLPAGGPGQVFGTPVGHAIEVRLYAEDPARDFAPTPGKLHHLRLPGDGESEPVRVDSGVRGGDEVTPFYDPMIAKIIAFGGGSDGDPGSARAEAIRRLSRALSEVEIAGLTTNLDYLRRLVDHPSFAACELETGFIANHGGDLLGGDEVTSEDLALACLAELCRDERRAAVWAASSSDPFSPFHMTNGWRLNSDTQRRMEFVCREQRHELLVHYRPQGYEIEIGSEGRFEAQGSLEADGRLSACLDGHRLLLRALWADGLLYVIHAGRTLAFRLAGALDLVHDDSGAGGRLASPMPGRVSRVLVSEGAEVEAGELLLVLEAMKMEHSIVAPAAGRVASLHYGEGDQVDEGVELIVFEAREEEA